MGVGVHLFFRNYLVNALIFFLMFLIYSIFAMSTNLVSYNQANQTQKNILCLLNDSETTDGCGFSAIGAGSKVIEHNESKDTYSQIQAWIGVGFTIIWGLIFIIKTHADESFLANMETNRVSSSDFTLMLTHVPKKILEKPYEEALK